MSRPTPWPMEKRKRIGAKLKRHAKELEGKLGADSVMILAFYREAGTMHLHSVDGGTVPAGISIVEAFEHHAAMHAVMAQKADGETVQ